jgi:hypothetical protein
MTVQLGPKQVFILTEIRSRKDTGRCSFKQAQILIKHGFHPDLSMQQAGGIIRELKWNRWKPTAELVRKAATLRPELGA